MLKSIVSVIAGYLTMAILVIVTTIIAAILLLQSQDQPTTPYLVVNLILGFFAAVVGGYITAKLAPQNKLRHVQVLAGVVIILGLLSLGQSANQPAWYPWVVMLIGGIGALAGGSYYELKNSPATAK